jgi:hypothetical protein
MDSTALSVEPPAPINTTLPAGKPTLLQIVLDYIERGWNPIPIAYREKGPKDRNWQRRPKLDAAKARQVFNGGLQNVGVQLGPESDWLTDVDLHCPEAVALASYFLPQTKAVFGRRSKRRSHWLYITDLAKTIDKAALAFDDPTRLNPDEKTKARLLELRIGGGGKGAQTVFPGSVHEEGELIEWDDKGDPAKTDGAALKQLVEAIAAGCLLVRYWPGEGLRHKAALVVGGVLARAGRTEGAIAQFVGAVARASGGPEVNDRQTAGKSAVKALAEGTNVYGLPALAELFGEKVAAKVAEWLGLKQGEETVKSELPDDGPNDFKRNTNGAPFPSQGYIRLALKKLGVQVRYNLFKTIVVIEGLESFGPELDDAGIIRFWLLVDEKLRFKPKKEFFLDVVGDAARRNSFHPVREYLSSLEWDGTPRLDFWLSRYGGAEDNEYTRAAGCLPLIAAVRRVRQPGVKFDEMLVLRSDQGTDKSSSLQILAGREEWFSDDLPLNEDAQKTIERTKESGLCKRLN